LQVLRFIHTTGKIEIAKMKKGARTFATTFEELITEINSAQDMLTELSNAIYNNESTIELYTKGKKEMIAIKEKLTA
jgi:aerotaxis receptor